MKLANRWSRALLRAAGTGLLCYGLFGAVVCFSSEKGSQTINLTTHLLLMFVGISVLSFEQVLSRR